MSKKVAIVIPTHKTVFSADDKTSLAHLRKHLHKYDTFFVIPKRLNPKTFRSLGYKVKVVSNNYFGTIQKYSEMILSPRFYDLFKDYDYILIYHLDAVVFSNQLEKWISSGYDYIAPPWFRSVVGTLSNKKDSPKSGGNGGFSLRNVKKSIEVLDIVNKSSVRNTKSSFKRKLWFLWAVITLKSHKIWLKAPSTNYPFHEDGFWSLEAPKYTEFKVAPFDQALQFGFEKSPKKLFKLNNEKLPFGAHAFKKYGFKFWKPFLQSA